jgi:hypothetical protein
MKNHQEVYILYAKIELNRLRYKVMFRAIRKKRINEHKILPAELASSKSYPLAIL